MTRILSFVILCISLSIFGGFSLPGQESLKEKLIKFQETGKLKVLTCYSGGIYFLDLKTGKPKPVLEMEKGGEYATYDCTFFPDGDKLAYVLNRNTLSPLVQDMLKKGEFDTKEKKKEINVVGSLENSSALEIFDLRTGTSEKLIEFPMLEGVSISPDGKSIGFVADTERRFSDREPKDVEDDLKMMRENAKHQSLYIYNIKSKDLEKIVDGKVFSIPSNASWSPDGKKLLYETINEELMVYNFDTSSSNLVAEKTVFPSWSADSARIIFRHVALIDAPGDQHTYYSIKPDGTDKKVFLENRKSEVGIPLFNHIGRIYTPIYPSPDGRLILYGRIKGQLENTIEVYVMDLQTGQVADLGGGFIEINGWHWAE